MSSVIESLEKDRPVRIGVIGLGGVAQVVHLPLIKDIEEFELVGICDTESFKLSKISDSYNVTGYIDPVQLIEKAKPDVVLICTPTITHLPLALKSMQAGAHVIIEKPVTRNLEEARRLQAAATQYGKHIFVAMNLRFRQDVMVLRQFLQASELGELWRVRAGWLKRSNTWARSPWLDQPTISGGGVLIDLGLQMLDFVHFLLGSPKPTRLSCDLSHMSLRKDVEDTATANIHFESGPNLLLDVSWGLMAERSVAYTYFEGTNGAAQLNPLVVHKSMHGELVNVAPVKTAKPNELYQESFRTQMAHFIQVLRGEGESLSSIFCSYHDIISVWKRRMSSPLPVCFQARYFRCDNR